MKVNPHGLMLCSLKAFKSQVGTGMSKQVATEVTLYDLSSAACDKRGEGQYVGM